TGPCKFLEIATEADFEYYQDFSSNVNTALNRIRTILNQVEGLYTGTFKVKFVLRYQQIWTTAADPYSGDTLQGILPQFTNWWNANRTSINRDVTHMFTGRSISNTTVGFAWIGVVCDANWYYSTVTNFSPVTMSTINLSTHELGHNFGAGHDITCNPSSIMCPNIQSGSVGWAATSITEINSHLNTISCLDESFPNSITFPSPGFPISYAKVLAINSIAINSALGPVEISNSGFAHLEAGNEIVLSPTVFNTTGFIANEGSAVLLRISDMVNTCLPLRLMPDNEVHITAADLSIFPNPANEFITVKLTSDAQTILKIYNSTMQLLKTIPFENGLENQISTADLSTGIYFIDAQSGNQSYKTKLVVNR
ncbi:MAG TPA: zinc-dependent metalloprotease, partial [Bacteroidia bacterium]|nr:zinc-dependent metalloprotease [Bacteroidia bacterium]